MVAQLQKRHQTQLSDKCNKCRSHLKFEDSLCSVHLSTQITPTACHLMPLSPLTYFINMDRYVLNQRESCTAEKGSIQDCACWRPGSTGTVSCVSSNLRRRILGGTTQPQSDASHLSNLRIVSLSLFPFVSLSRCLFVSLSLCIFFS